MALTQHNNTPQGFKGFVRVGDRELSVEEQLCRELEGMGFEPESAATAAKAASKQGTNPALFTIGLCVPLSLPWVFAGQREIGIHMSGTEVAGIRYALYDTEIDCWPRRSLRSVRY